MEFPCTRWLLESADKENQRQRLDGSDGKNRMTFMSDLQLMKQLTAPVQAMKTASYLLSEALRFVQIHSLAKIL